MVLILTRWNIAVILENQLARLYNIQKHIIKNGGSLKEVNRSIEKIKYRIADLCMEDDDDIE